MKNSYLLIIAAGIVCLTACNKETNAIEETIEANGSVKMITETVTAQYGNETKVTIADGGAFSWTEGDHIAVHVSNGDNPKYVLTSDSGASGASASAATASFTVVYEEGYTRDAFAVYPATIVAENAANYGQSGATLDITLPSSYKLSEVSETTTPCPMIATNTPGSGWAFKQLCSLLRLTIDNIPTEANKLKIGFHGRKVSGAFSIPAPVTPGTSTIASVAGTEGTDDYIWITEIGDVTEVTINLPLPTGAAYSDLVVSSWKDDAALKAQVTPFTFNPSNAKGKKLTSSLTLGAFQSAAGKYIVFSPGNLQYQASSSTWRFAEHQYDYVGNATDGTVYVGETKSDNALIAEDYTGWIDLFGWGTSGKTVDGYGSNYQPWFTDSTNEQYGPVGTYGLYDNGGGKDFTSGDWGEGAKANIGAGWRTLTSAEWTYLFNDRTSVTNRYCKATVDGKSGVVLFPDSYTGDAPDSPNTDNAGYSTNEWNATQWAAMEAAGCVFLPAAGARYGTTVGSPGIYGGYWSSTPINATFAFLLNFNVSYVNPANNDARSYSYSVRLVQNP